MRPLWTAKEDQPGPIGRRHSSTGGDAVQSVTIRTPGILPSRRGPRNPGQLGSATGAAVVSLGTALAGIGAGSVGTGITGGVAGADAGAAESLTSSLAAWTKSRSSGVCVHRQCN